MSTRVDRIAEELQREVALIIHQELKDPRLGFVTITRVELTKDLRYAKVRYSCLGGEPERARTQEALDRAASFVRGLVRRRFHLKVVPEFSFYYDAAIEGSIAMMERLDQLNRPAPEQG